MNRKDFLKLLLVVPVIALFGKNIFAKNKEDIIVEALETDEGRMLLYLAMTEPIRRSCYVHLREKN